MSIKKNKIHNPQLVTDLVPSTVTEEDLGRMWIDTEHDGIYVAIKNKFTGVPELRSMLDSSTMTAIDGAYFSDIVYEYSLIIPQEAGDKHYELGYDFFNDAIYIENATQENDDFYAFYYIEVSSTDAPNYIRSISTESGIKHVRAANGYDTYDYMSVTYPLTNYSKIVLNSPIKAVVDIKFENKDVLETGFELLNDKRTILIYADPEGFFINSLVKVRCVI